MACWLNWNRNGKLIQMPSQHKTMRMKSPFDVKLFTYKFIKDATHNFANPVGSGACATVYKGILPDGRVVAVKKLKTDKTYGYTNGFLPVVELISRLRHRNLIQVIGCCMEGDHRIIVCEYAKGGDLYKFLTEARRKNDRDFTWAKRASICIGIARGLSYLHEDVNPRVIHRDIKSANILLDDDLNPLIADFDLADFVGCEAELPRMGMVVGTEGYLDPKYKRTSEYTEKVDVFSFGVVMFEIITGRKAVKLAGTNGMRRPKYLVNWVRAKLEQHKVVLKVVDPMLQMDRNEEREVKHFINVALKCIQRSEEMRPSMFEVVLMLRGLCCCLGQETLSFDQIDCLESDENQSNDNKTEASSSSSITTSSNRRDGKMSIVSSQGEGNTWSDILHPERFWTVIDMKNQAKNCKKHKSPEVVFPPMVVGAYGRSISGNERFRPSFPQYSMQVYLKRG